MSILEKLYEGLKSQVEMRSDIDRASARLDRMSGDILDHEKRLIRIETLIEVTRGDFGPRRLPQE